MKGFWAIQRSFFVVFFTTSDVDWFDSRNIRFRFLIERTRRTKYTTGEGRKHSMLKKLQAKTGFISIETVIVAGLMIGLGVFAITQFYTVGETSVNGAVDRINAVMDVVAGE